MGEPAAGGIQLDEEQVRERFTLLDRLLEDVEQVPGPTTDKALDAVATLAEVYGAALTRIVRAAAEHPALIAALVDDELVSHLLALHDIHPLPLAERVGRALDDVRPYLQSHGGDVTFEGVDEQGVARLSLSGSCQGCSSSAETMKHAVEEAVLGLAPELQAVEAASAKTATVISPESLLRRPSVTGPGAPR